MTSWIHIDTGMLPLSAKTLISASLFDLMFVVFNIFISYILICLLQIGRPYVLSKCKDYPKFQAVAIAIQRSGFKVTYCELDVITVWNEEYSYF
jgi:hypothetical protein